MNCSLCDREQLLRAGNYPYLIKEFKNSWWILGEHQYYQGYSLILVKGHHREMTDLPDKVSAEVFQEFLQAQKATLKAFKPAKLNLCSLGNVVPHLHWHIFPRYADDPKRENPPWLQMNEFSSKNISAIDAKAPIAKLLENLE